MHLYLYVRLFERPYLYDMTRMYNNEKYGSPAGHATVCRSLNLLWRVLRTSPKGYDIIIIIICMCEEGLSSKKNKTGLPRPE